MYVVVFTSLLALLLTYMEIKGFKNGMRYAFILVTILGCIHYDYGSDYMAYYDTYKDIVSIPFSWNYLVSGSIYKEPGWALINYAFKPIGGFFMLVAVLNIIQNIFYYKFIKNNVKRSWWPIAIFIYLFCTSFYLLNFSMMRQGFVVAILLGLWKYIQNKQWVIALCGLLMTSFIHLSALIVLPLAFWGFLEMKNTRFFSILYVLLFIVLWSMDDFLNNVLTTLLAFDNFQNYEYYANTSDSVSYGMGFMLNLIPFVVSLRYLWFGSQHLRKENQMVALTALGYMIFPFTQIIPLISRVGIYFNVFSIGAFALSYNSIHTKLIKYGLVSIFILMTLYDYWIFFNNSIYKDSYMTFHTIFSVL